MSEAVGSGGREGTVRRARPLLGTLVEIEVEGTQSELAVERAFEAIAQVHDLMSFHDPASELSRVNREAARAPVQVSEPMWEVLQAARRLSAASDGLFDITTASALVGHGFLPAAPVHTRPCATVGDWHHLELLPGRRVWFARPLCIDLGGIAKGFAVDRATEVLRAAGVRRGRVNAGGDLRVFGAGPEPLHVRHPSQPGVLIPLPPVEASVATSAGYYQRSANVGPAMVPIVHPETGELSRGQRSVTVYAPECMSADALTKVVYLDPARATPLLAEFGARAIVLEPEPDGGCRLYRSEPSPERLTVT